MKTTALRNLLVLCLSIGIMASMHAQTAQSLTDVANGMTAPASTPGPTINEFGSCTFYNDLVDFQTACGEFPIEDFEGSIVNPGSTNSCIGPVNSTSANCYNIGDLIPGFSLNTPNSSIVLAGDGFSPRINTTMIGANTFVQPLEITFDASDVTAVSFDLTTETSQGDVQIDIYDLSNTLMGTTVVNTVGSEAKFFAMSVEDPISRIVLTANFGNGAELIDNLTFGACKVIPTMGQWALLILGLIMSSLAIVFVKRKESTIA